MSFNTNDESQVKDLLTIKSETEIVTAAGATEINNDLTATIDNLANNYYTKSETSSVSELNTKFEAVIGLINDLRAELTQVTEAEE